MNKVATWGVLLTAMLLLSVMPALGAAPETPATGSGELLDARAAFSLIQKNRTNHNFVVLDVRTPDEFKSGHIEGAINIDYESGGFKTEVSELDKKKTYFVYCRTGRRSGEAVRIMKDLGFRNIVRMKGDILTWQSENLPLVK